MRTTVRMRHTSGAESDVVSTAVRTWARYGWTVVDDESDVAEPVEEADEGVWTSGPVDPDDPDKE